MRQNNNKNKVPPNEGRKQKLREIKVNLTEKMAENPGFTASEVARLVMGYLQSQNCPQTAEKLTQECPEDFKLKEFSALVSAGILKRFDVDGQSLNDILTEYRE